MPTLKLNADIGESFGPWTMGQDDQIMPLVDMANVACGFHASDPVTMQRTLTLARRHGVTIGAHPAYPDLVGFGRRSMVCTPEEVQALIWYQVGALQGMADPLGMTVSYVKPHGALNNDMMQNDDLLHTVMSAVKACNKGLSLMLPVSLDFPRHQAMADELGLTLIPEAFADRAYDDSGRLVSRSQPGAVHHDTDTIVDQARSFADKGGLYSVTGQWLDLPAQSLCVHGDNEESIAAVARIRQALGSDA